MYINILYKRVDNTFYCKIYSAVHGRSGKAKSKKQQNCPDNDDGDDYYDDHLRTLLYI